MGASLESIGITMIVLELMRPCTRWRGDGRCGRWRLRLLGVFSVYEASTPSHFGSVHYFGLGDTSSDPHDRAQVFAEPFGMSVMGGFADMKSKYNYVYMVYGDTYNRGLFMSAMAHVVHETSGFTMCRVAEIEAHNLLKPKGPQDVQRNRQNSPLTLF